MTKNLLNLFALFSVMSCNTTTNETRQKNVDELTHVVPHEHQSLDSAEIVLSKFEVVLENVYKQSEKNIPKTLLQIDSLLFNCDTNYKRTRHSINNNMMKDLHFLKGELLFKCKAYSKALDEFTFDTIVDYNIGRAACLLKLNRESEAFQNIQNAKGYCYSGFVLGNYYEIVGKPDSALSVYKLTMSRDGIEGTRLYDTILTRIKELNRRKNSKHFSLSIPTRRPSRLLDACN